MLQHNSLEIWVEVSVILQQRKTHSGEFATEGYECSRARPESL